jgi:hypothetical protein
MKDPRLVSQLMDIFPGSVYVSEAGLAQAIDILMLNLYALMHANDDPD